MYAAATEYGEERASDARACPGPRFFCVRVHNSRPSQGSRRKEDAVMSTIQSIRKRSGEVVPFTPEKITRAIFKAANAVGGNDWERSEELCRQVV